MSARKVMCVTGRRAEFGLARSVFEAIHASDELELQLLVTGDHLLPEFGETARLVTESGLPVLGTVDAAPADDSRAAMVDVVGRQVLGIGEQIGILGPDVLLALTDLGHALATAIVGQYAGIPVAHLHGGDVSGNVDDPVRHAVTKLSHVHFAASPASGERIVRMGEEPWRVHVTGAPGLDTILRAPLPGRESIESMLGLEPGAAYLLVLVHPQSSEQPPAEAMRLVLEATSAAGLPIAAVYPNADAGGRAMIEVIESFAAKGAVHAYANLERDVFLSLMKHAAAMVGNSSSGIIEAPSFRTPVVNVGGRQAGRERACNVIDVAWDAGAVAAAIQAARGDEVFRRALESCESPYGDGHAGERIVRILEDLELGEKLLVKKMTY